MTSSEPMKFAQFLVVFIRKSMLKKYLISNRFDFFCVFFNNYVRAFYILFGQERVCNFKITYLFQYIFSIIKV